MLYITNYAALPSLTDTDLNKIRQVHRRLNPIRHFWRRGMIQQDTEPVDYDGMTQQDTAPEQQLSY